MKHGLKILFLLCISIAVFGQHYHIVYKVDFKPQITNSTIKTEYMALDTYKNESIFYNLNYKKPDTLSAKTETKNETQFLRFKIKQNNNSYSYYGNFNNFLFTYNETLPSSWKITNKSYIYKAYNVQEAEIEFEGRKWIALFASELPINKGPYKFSNLPGLIVKAFSLDGDYVFDMIELKKLPKNQLRQPEGKYTAVKKNKIDQMISEFLKDPAAQNITIVNESQDSYSYKFNGKKDESYYDMKSFIEETIAKFDNPIDKKTYILIF